jgi:hypothetical protein
MTVTSCGTAVGCAVGEGVSAGTVEGPGTGTTEGPGVTLGVKLNRASPDAVADTNGLGEA